MWFYISSFTFYVFFDIFNLGSKLPQLVAIKNLTGEFTLTKEFKTKEIRGTKTVAQKLIAARKKMKISLLDAERYTNIRLKYLEAFEDNKFEVFPSEVYAVGFLRRYAEYLSLNPASIVPQYKIEWNAATSLSATKNNPDFSPKSLPRFEFSVTPKTIAVFFAIVLVASLLIYIWWAVKKFSAPPSLLITQPYQNQQITDDKILIKGKTEPGNYVYINKEAINVGSDGKFSQEVGLGEGMTTLQIVAKNRLDRRSIHVIKVIDEKPTDSQNTEQK